MKKFVSYTIFKSKFCPYIKGRYPRNELDKQRSFFVWPSLQNFPTVQNGPENRKDLYLIKLVSKWKRAIKKEHTSFLLFHFLGLKLVPINSAINSASDNLTHFFQKRRRCTKKSNQTRKSELKLFWNVFCDI